MDPKKRVALVATFTLLCVAYAFAVTQADELRAGLGVSDRDIHANMQLNQPTTFSVARIYNEGTLNLTVTVKWEPDDPASNKSLYVIVPETSIPLTVGATREVQITVTPAQEGNFSGKIRFKGIAVLPEGYSGNPTRPGGTARFAAIVGEPQTPPPKKGGNPALVPIVGVSLICLASVCIVVWRRRQKS